MTITIRFKRAVVVDEKKVKLKPGTTVKEALKEFGYAGALYDPRKSRVFREAGRDELVLLGHDTRLDSDTALVVLAPYSLGSGLTGAGSTAGDAITVTLKRSLVSPEADELELNPGTTVGEALLATEKFDTPGQWAKCRVYQESGGGVLVLLNKDAPLDSETSLCVLSPLLGAADISGGATFGGFWRGAIADFCKNVVYGFPIFAVVAVYLFASAYWMLLAERDGANTEVHSYWDALYLTWITMTTVGFGDLTPKSPWGRVLASADGRGLACN
jgi:hypothetical protein